MSLNVRLTGERLHGANTTGTLIVYSVRRSHQLWPTSSALEMPYLQVGAQAVAKKRRDITRSCRLRTKVYRS